MLELWPLSQAPQQDVQNLLCSRCRLPDHFFGPGKLVRFLVIADISGLPQCFFA